MGKLHEKKWFSSVWFNFSCRRIDVSAPAGRGERTPRPLWGIRKDTVLWGGECGERLFHQQLPRPESDQRNHRMNRRAPDQRRARYVAQAHSAWPPPKLRNQIHVTESYFFPYTFVSRPRNSDHGSHSSKSGWLPFVLFYSKCEF